MPRCTARCCEALAAQCCVKGMGQGFGRACLPDQSSMEPCVESWAIDFVAMLILTCPILWLTIASCDLQHPLISMHLSPPLPIPLPYVPPDRKAPTTRSERLTQAPKAAAAGMLLPPRAPPSIARTGDTTGCASQRSKTLSATCMCCCVAHVSGQPGAAAVGQGSLCSALSAAPSLLAAPKASSQHLSPVSLTLPQCALSRAVLCCPAHICSCRQRVGCNVLLCHPLPVICG